MADEANQLGELLRTIRTDGGKGLSAATARYAVGVAELQRDAMHTAAVHDPAKTLLARIGLGDMAWVLHLRKAYSNVARSMAALDAVTPAPPAVLVAQRCPWPKGFEPATSRRSRLYNPFTWGRLAVSVKNVLAVPHLPPRSLFEAVRHAGVWQDYYANGGEASVKSLDHLGQHFSFRTFATTFRSEVVIYEDSGEVLSIGWRARGALGTAVVHRWDIYPDGKAGAIVTTEETQRGFKPMLSAALLEWAMRITHQNWLYGQVVAAESL